MRENDFPDVQSTLGKRKEEEKMKLRKIGAAFLAAAMLVGSCLTASAADIPQETCTVEYKQMSQELGVEASVEKVGSKR